MDTRFPQVVLLAFSLLSAAPLHGGLHTFTDTTGRTVSAEILAATEDSVRVKLKKNGKESTIPLSKLSEEDQTFVEDWREEHDSEQARLATEEEDRRRAEELPLMLVAFCKQNLGKQVGNGECWTLANEAFRSCGLARPGGDSRVWGRLLDLKQEKLAPGDIVEYRNAKFSNGSSTGLAHTSVVVKGGRWGSATIAEQNWSGHKTVREAPFDSRSLIEGEVMVYRPNYSKTQN
jgi:hypothetical protein